MPSFKVHIAASAAVGVAGAALGVSWLGWGPDISALAGLCGFAGGMVPDLDSDSGRPVRIVGGLTSLILSIGLIHVLVKMGRPALETAVTSGAVLLILNTSGIKAFKAMTSHRGMFHSILTAIGYAAGLTVFFGSLGRPAALGVALAGAAGVMSHLLLDMLFSLSLKPLKVWSKDRTATVFAWLVTGGLVALAWRAIG